MKEYIIFVGSEHYNSLGLIRSLGEIGIKSIVVIVKGPAKFVGQSKYVKKRKYVADLSEGYDYIYDNYKSETEKSFILTGDDDVVSYLDCRFNELKDHFYFYNCGQPGVITHLMNKDVMFDLVQKNGLNVIKTWKVNVGDIPNDIKYPVLTKAINSISEEWKDIVFVCNNDDELTSAFSKMKSKKILLQQYIEKVDEVSFDGISCNKGKETIICTEVYQEYCLKDKYSPYWDVRNNANLDITNKIKKIISDISYEGIFEFEFLIDKDGKLWFLEINFRNTALGYASTCAGISQVLLWCDAMINGRIKSDYYKIIPNGFKAIAECFDYDARVKTGMISRKKWMKQYREAQCKLYRGHDDIIPFIRFLIYKYTKMNKK